MLWCYIGIKMQDDDSNRPRAGTLLGAEGGNFKRKFHDPLQIPETFGEVKGVPGQGPPRHSRGTCLEMGPLLLCGRGSWAGWPFTDSM